MIRTGSKLTLALLLSCGFHAYVFSAAEMPVSVTTADATPAWPRPGAAIVQLSHAPALDGVVGPKEWDQAVVMPLRFASGSNKAVEKPDARFRAGHKDGVLYLLLEFDWTDQADPKTTAVKRDGAVWEDDGAEIFLCDSAHL